MTDDVIEVNGSEAEPRPSVAGMALEPVGAGGLVRPAADKDTIVAAFVEYTELTQALLTNDDWQAIGGKRFTKRSGLRKLGTAFSVSSEIRSFTHTYDDEGRIVRSEFVVRCTAPNGRYQDGYGACSVWDRCDRGCKGRAGGCEGFKHFSKPEHDVPATAETRAKNRASADLFAMGAVSAEEVDNSDPSTRRATRDEVAAVIEYCKALKDEGGDPGKWPVVLGVTVLENEVDEASGEKMTRYLITGAEAVELVERLTAALDARRTKDTEAVGSPADAVSATPAPDPAPMAPAPVQENGAGGTVEEEPQPEVDDAGEHPAAPAAAEAIDESAVDAAPSLPLGDGDSDQGGTEPSTGEPESVSTTGEGADSGPTDEPIEAGKVSRIAMGCKAVWHDGTDGDARHMLASIISGGQESSTRKLTNAEADLMIRAVRLFQNGELVFATVLPSTGKAKKRAEPCQTTEQGTPGLPEKGANITVVPAAPEGGNLTRGNQFLADLKAHFQATGRLR